MRPRRRVTRAPWHKLQRPLPDRRRPAPANREDLRLSGTRFAMGTTVRNQSNEAVASVTLIGPTPDLKPRMRQLSDLLIRYVDSWSQRSMISREAI